MKTVVLGLGNPILSDERGKRLWVSLNIALLASKKSKRRMIWLKKQR